MRVLFWSERFWPQIGGVGIASRRLLPALSARGYQFLVITARDEMDLPEEDELDGIPVIRLPVLTALGQRDLAALAALQQRVAALKRSFAAELVHINFLGATVFLHAQTRSIHPSPVLVSFDSGLPQRSTGPSLFEETLASAAWVTCVSQASLGALLERVPEVRDRSSVILPGCEAPPLRPSTLPRESPHLLCLGRVVHIKGFDLALDAFARVREWFPAARLTIAGDGPALPDLMRRASGLCLTTVTNFPGWIDPRSVWSLLDTATIVIMPSRSEQFGLVALEAALMGRPVIAARVGGLPEVVADNVTGVLVTPDDVTALVGAMALLLEDPERAERLGQAARERALAVFNWQGYVDAYDALYRRLSGRD